MNIALTTGRERILRSDHPHGSGATRKSGAGNYLNRVLHIRPQKIRNLEDFLADRRDWFPGGRGARGDILSKAE
jgi:hypothetical protein